MRVAPAALQCYRTPERVVTVARQTAVITHTHELGIEGAVLQAYAVAQALRDDPSEGVEAGAFVGALREQATTAVFQQKLQTAGQLLGVGERTDRASVVSLLGNGIAATESVPTAIYSFLRYPDSFKDAVSFAISLGGDTDTIASMAGAISGAYLGLNAIPEAWRDEVEGSARLQELADSLLALAQQSGP
jgi:poly(ADP-ribose) glycohydrolase ARH3